MDAFYEWCVRFGKLESTPKLTPMERLHAAFEAGRRAERKRIAQYVRDEWEQWITRDGLPDAIAADVPSDV